jgi:hypothetical protein
VNTTVVQDNTSGPYCVVWKEEKAEDYTQPHYATRFVPHHRKSSERGNVCARLILRKVFVVVVVMCNKVGKELYTQRTEEKRNK